MAQTIAQYYQTIIAEVQSQTTLNAQLGGELPVGSDPTNTATALARMQALLTALTSGSQVAIWRLWAFVMAVICWIQATLWDTANAQLVALEAQAPSINNQWMVDVAKQYQFGDSLVAQAVPNGLYRLTYNTIDPTVQIISAATISTTATGVSVLKVATNPGTGLTALSPDQLSGFAAYMKQVQPPGCNVIVQSGNADTLRMTVNVWYDPTVIGNTAVITAVQTAVMNNIAALPFSGVLTKQQIEDCINATTGVVYLQIVSLQVKAAGALDYADLDIKYFPSAGYIVPDLSSSSAYFTVIPTAQIGA